MSLAQGDIVELISNEVIENVTNRRWISGRNLNTNQSGEFPTDAVQILPVLSAPDAALQVFKVNRLIFHFIC